MTLPASELDERRLRAALAALPGPGDDDEDDDDETPIGDPDDDDDVLDEQVKQVKTRIQSMIHVGLREREHVFW